WHHPHRGLVAPDYFIQIAEESGLIKPLGWWVLHQACQQLRLWQDQSLLAPSVVMSVNLSSKQFLQFDLFEHIQQTLVDTNLPRHNLKLEITESTVMNDLDNTTLKLKQLRNSGIHLSIDDFGTGYSSLSYLHRFPFDTLKVDRSFIGRMDQQRENSAIVKTIVDLAHNLGMDIVAEGVESQKQLYQLQRLGCEQVQGYFFAPPLPADCLVEYFEKIQMDRPLRPFFSLG
ncbi:MAG: EAL domain-containing protein, partial [Merismopedia sp. SIO2A8]|nr:EAL domain-containing protein [Merismopedia sp. SIO2A8]